MRNHQTEECEEIDVECDFKSIGCDYTKVSALVHCILVDFSKADRTANFKNAWTLKIKPRLWQDYLLQGQGWKESRTMVPLVPENFLSSQKIFPQEREI
jgi:hypothetical protein